MNPWTLENLESLAPSPEIWAEAVAADGPKAVQNLRSTAVYGRQWSSPVGLENDYTFVVVHLRQEQSNLRCRCSQHGDDTWCVHGLVLARYLVHHPDHLQLPELPAVVPELDALVRACFAQPEANLPRLVLADYLDEQGENDRATILRIQCELPPPKAGQKPRIHRRMAKPLKEAIDRLSPRIQPPNWPQWKAWSFVRGFLSIHAQYSDFPDLDWVEPLFRNGWIETLRLWSFTGAQSPAVLHLYRQVGTLDLRESSLDQQEFLQIPLAFAPGRADSRIQRILVRESDQPQLDAVLGRPASEPAQNPRDRYYPQLTPDTTRVLATTGLLDGVESLSLTGHPGTEGARHLAAAPAMRSVRTLRLEFPHLEEAGWRHLAATPAGSLAWLHVSHPTDAIVRALCNGTLLPTNELWLTSDNLTTDAARALAACPRLQTLRELWLCSSQIGDEGLTAILTSPHLAGPLTLHANRRGVTAGGLLAAAFRVPAGHTHTVAHEDFTVTIHRPAGGHVGMRFSAPASDLKWLDGLVCPELLSEFELAACYFYSSRVTALLARLRNWFAGHTAEVLSFLACDIDQQNIAEVLELVGEIRPAVLKLNNNRVGAWACKAVANSPALATVRELHLQNNPLRLSGVLALADSPHRSALESLVLTGAKFTKEERRRIQQAFAGVQVTL